MGFLRSGLRLRVFAGDVEGILGPATPFLFPTLPTTINSTADLLNLPVYNLPQSIYSGIGVGNGTFPGFYDHGQGGTNKRIHPWIADTWKVKPNLTINFGLGYDLETGLFYSNLPLPQYLAPILKVNRRFRWPGRDAAQQAGFLARNSDSHGPSARARRPSFAAAAGMYWDTQPIWQHFREGASIGPPGDGRNDAGRQRIHQYHSRDSSTWRRRVQPLQVGAPLPLGALTTMTLGQFIQIVNQQLPGLTAELAPTPPASGPFSVGGIDIAKQGIEIYPSQFPAAAKLSDLTSACSMSSGHDMRVERGLGSPPR